MVAGIGSSDTGTIVDLREIFGAGQPRRLRAGQKFYAVWLVLLTALLWPPAVSASEQRSVPTREIKLTGRVVCLAEELERTADVGIRSQHDHLWGFKADDGSLYTLLETRLSEALFLDDRLRSEKLIVSGRVFADSHIFEAVKLQSARGDELYYFCTVCSIKSVTPRECVCCQQPVELIGLPAKEVP